MSKELAKEVFDSSIEAGLSRDLVIVEMVKKGISLNTAQNLYKEYATEAGLTTSRTGHKADAIAHLEETTPDILDNDSRADVRASLQEKFGVASSTANDYIKAYAEKAGIELPRSNFGSSPEDQETIFTWIAENANCEKAAFAAFMKETMGRSSGSIDETFRGIQLARKLQAAGIEFEEA
jgi:hypothetical protein